MKNIKKIIVILVILIVNIGVSRIQFLQASDAGIIDSDIEYNSKKLNKLIEGGMLKGEIEEAKNAMPLLNDMAALEKFKNFILNNEVRKKRFKIAFNTLLKKSEPNYLEVEVELYKRFGPDFFDKIDVDVSKVPEIAKTLAQRMAEKAQSISEAVEKKWDQGKEIVGEAVGRAETWLSTEEDQLVARNVSEAWKKITSAPMRKSISDLSRVACINKFLYSIKNNEVNDALSCLAKEKLNIFDQNDQNVFNALVSEFYATPAREQEKRALILFSLYTIYSFSLDKMNEIEKKVAAHKIFLSPENLRKKKNQLKSANHDLQEILTQELARKKV